MTDHILAAYRIDIETRTSSSGNQRESPQGHRVNAHEIAAGVIGRDLDIY